MSDDWGTSTPADGTAVAESSQPGSRFQSKTGFLILGRNVPLHRAGKFGFQARWDVHESDAEKHTLLLERVASNPKQRGAFRLYRIITNKVSGEVTQRESGMYELMEPGDKRRDGQPLNIKNKYLDGIFTDLGPYGFSQVYINPDPQDPEPDPLKKRKVLNIRVKVLLSPSGSNVTGPDDFGVAEEKPATSEPSTKEEMAAAVAEVGF